MLETWKVRESESVVSVVRLASGCVCWLGVEREGAGRSRVVVSRESDRLVERTEARDQNAEGVERMARRKRGHESYNIHVYKAYIKPICQYRRRYSHTIASI